MTALAARVLSIHVTKLSNETHCIWLQSMESSTVRHMTEITDSSLNYLQAAMAMEGKVDEWKKSLEESDEWRMIFEGFERKMSSETNSEEISEWKIGKILEGLDERK